MEKRISSNRITSLRPNEIFVFGSNLLGIHGAGAALYALRNFGAESGKGHGFTGQCYAIPTKDYEIQTLELDVIRSFVFEFDYEAYINPDLDFLVTEIGCGLAGYKPEDIAPMFKSASELSNVFLPISFWEVLSQK